VEQSVSGVGVLDKAVRILEALSPGTRLTLGELAAATGMPRATTHRLAHALRAHHLAELGADERWSLGLRLAELAQLGIDVRGRPSLAEAARPALEALREATGESVQLYVPRGGVRLCIASLESPHSLRTIVPLGARLPLDAGSAATVLADGAEAREHGWAQSVEERERGVASVSAPVRRYGSVVAAVSVSGPVERTTRAPGRRYARAVVAAGREVERALGWDGGGAGVHVGLDTG
jgi:DNA-binding IclR family transcriptional regulator